MKNDKTQMVKQFLECSHKISDGVCNYLVYSNITTKQLQEILNLPREEIDKISTEIAQRYLQLVPDLITQTKQQLQKYFLEIFNLKINLSKTMFQQKDGFNTFMAVPHLAKLNEDKIMAAFVKKWGINTYKYLSSVAKNINRDEEHKNQPRPKGLYVFAHRGGDEPDKEHLGESYDDAISAGYSFANAREYLLITGFHKFIKSKFMDKKAWTRT
ncbi:MAG: hypothetical protein GY793_09190, partial [Proteobacteria bacterium]|nr:hypothetical protein [Pseudomonadota bacterium]